MNRREFLVKTSCFSAVTALSGLSFADTKSKSEKPNIIWIMAEDIGCDLACYGMAAVKTPNLDQLAKDGLQCNRAYVTSPICSPSRSAMMTGMYQTSIDAHNHRSHRSDGYRLPKPIKPITHYLRQAGYYCAVGCGYGKKTDMNFKTQALFDGPDWSKRAKGQPFFANMQLGVTHRKTSPLWEQTRKESKHPVDPADVKLPPIFPDHPAVRQDWAEYLDQIEKADDQIAEILA